MKPFEDLVVSTKTVIAFSNIEFDIPILMEHFLVEHVSHVSLQPVHHHHDDDMYTEDEMIDFTQYQVKLQSIYYKKTFRNALNVIYHIHRGVDDNGHVASSSTTHQRRVNIKIHKNGKFQLTGCKYIEFAKLCLWDFIERVQSCLPHALTLRQQPIHGSDSTDLPNTIYLFFQTVMTNVDFSLGFTVDRQKLDWFMNKSTHYYSLLETSFGYTGVNIKFPLQCEWWKTPCPKMKWILSSHDIYHTMVPLDTFVSKDIIERLQRKGKYNTFLVFHSGKIIMSGMFLSTMKADYNHFLHIIAQWRPWIEEKIYSTTTPASPPLPSIDPPPISNL